MNPKKIRGKKGPEQKIQEDIMKMLRYKGWYVKRMASSAFLSGVPDLYATHTSYGARWIEVKLPDMKGSHFTPAQMIDFPKLCANGAGVWILTGDSDHEYSKLFKKYNFTEYMLKKL